MTDNTNRCFRILYFLIDQAEYHKKTFWYKTVISSVEIYDKTDHTNIQMEVNTIHHSYKKILFQWKIVNNNQCNFCGNEEDYLHYFITCSFF